MTDVKDASALSVKSLSNDIESSPTHGLQTVISNGDVITIEEKDMDVAARYADKANEIELDPVKEKKLVRKLDIFLMPMIVALMGCQMMDKTANSYGSVMSMRSDLNMTDAEYSWVASAFYLGYMVANYPASMLLQRFPISKTLSCAVVIWGVILICHVACTNAASFLACRTLLGMFESFMDPAYILLTSTYYRKNEQYMRSSLWYGSLGVGTIFASGTSYGLVIHRGITGQKFASWKVLFVIAGCITIALGIASAFHTPDEPTKAWFLTEEEKLYCVRRAKDNQQGFGSHKFKSSQVAEAFKDVTTYLIFIYAMSYSIPNGGLNNYGSILLNDDFQFSTADSVLMNMPGGAIDIIFPPLAAWISKHWLKGSRLTSMVIINVLCIVGTGLLDFTKPKGSRLTGYLTLYLSTTCMAGIASVVSSNVAGYTKKITVGCVFLVGYCAGNMIGPQTFVETQAPGYAGAKTAMFVSYIVGAFAIAALLVIYRRRNVQREKKKQELGEKYVIPDKIAFADLTDKQNPEFVYSL